MKKWLSLFSALTLVFMLCACQLERNVPGASSQGDDASPDGSGSSSAGSENTWANGEMFTDRDYEIGYDESSCILIRLNGNSVSCSSDAVRISGTTVVITKEADYLITGTLDNGMVIVDAPDTAKLQIVLDGASIHSETSAALYILEADKVFLTLAEGTENNLSNGGVFEAIDDNNIDGAVFSKQDLTMNGKGTLIVTSPGGHGIVCKDDLVITSGTYAVTSASHGLDVNDSVRIANAEITIEAGKDGIHCENSDDTTLGYIYLAGGDITVEAQGDGISAGNYLQMADGTVDIVAGGGSVNGSSGSSDFYGDFMGGMGGGRPGRSYSSASSGDDGTSMKGLKAGGGIRILEGVVTIDSADDAIHSNTTVNIEGGTFEIASGDDGVHAETTLAITGCSMEITKSYEGLEALEIYVSGGEISVAASDDGLNAAGGTDSSGAGGRDAMYGGMGGMGGMSGSSNGYIEISGGSLYIQMSGDGIDANGSLLICGGYVVVCGPTNGDTAILDYDKTGVISGGTFIGTGGYAMAQTLTGDGQGVFAVTCSASAGTNITLADANGTLLVDRTPQNAFNLIIISTPEIRAGESYIIWVGEQSGTFEAN